MRLSARGYRTVCTAMTVLFGVLCAAGCLPGRRSTPRSAMPDPGPVLRVAAYSYALGVIQERLDLRSGQLVAIEKRLARRGDSYVYTIRKASATRSEVDLLVKKIAKAELDLRSFNPRLSWFRGIPPIHTGNVFEIKWKNQTVLLARPRDSMLGGVPEKARKVYSELESIEGDCCEIGGRLYGDGVLISKVGPEHPLAKSFERDWASMQMNSLPKGRRGW